MKNTLLFALPLLILQACNTHKKCVENIKPDCICTMQYDPVCGCNNKTYGNACAAACAGITTFTKGACKDATNGGLEGLVWQVVSFMPAKSGTTAPQPVPVPADVTVSIKFEGGKVDGHGGCNHVGGSYVMNGNSLTVTGLLSTKMYCESAMKWETMFLDWLPESKSYTVKGETLEINCGEKGSIVFRLNWKKRKGE